MELLIFVLYLGDAFLFIYGMIEVENSGVFFIKGKGEGGIEVETEQLPGFFFQ